MMAEASGPPEAPALGAVPELLDGDGVDAAAAAGNEDERQPDGAERSA